MTPIEEVRRLVLDTVPPTGSEPVELAHTVGRVLAADVVAPEDVPPFPNSAMDGFAVRAADVARPGAVLQVIEDVPAGKVATRIVGEGEAIRIMTGAPMPQGADTVVRVEDTEAQEDKVHILVAVEEGTSVRPAGGDVRTGEVVLEQGTRIGPAHLGVMANLGVVTPMVARRPKVALMSTGDELRPAETPILPPGAIRDSNRPMLAALLPEAGAEVADRGSVPDDPERLGAVITEAAEEADVIVTSGGVSMGDYDVTKMLLGGGSDVEFYQVAMKPAKPFAFGTVRGTPFFGLPGNPVSVFISFEQFVRPALLAMQGAKALFRPLVMGVAGERLDTDAAKTVFVRVRFVDQEGELRVVSSGGQQSNVLSAMADADALAVVPVGTAVVEEGEQVRLELFRAAETRGLADAG